MNFGYKGEALMPFTLRLSEGFAGEALRMRAHGQLLVCADVCIPQPVEARLELPVGDGLPDPGVAQLFALARSRLPVPLPAAAAYQLTDDGLILAELALPMGAGHRVDRIAYFPFARDLVEPAAEQRFAVHPGGLSLWLKPGYDFQPGADLSGVLVVSEAVGDGLESAYELQLPASASLAARAGDKPGGALASSPIVGVGGMPHGPASPVAGKGGKPSGLPASPMAAGADGTPFTLGLPTAGSAPGVEGMSLVVALAFAFLGGLILNLMPCVFPVLSIKILSLVEGAGGGGIRLHGWVYALGVVASFLAIALALIALRLSGEGLGWGFQLQSPLIVALLAYLFVLIGLNLLGVFEFGTRVMGYGAGGGGQPGSYAASFGTGALATTVAAPCTAPFMGAAIGYALTQPTVFGLAVFASLGAGMAAPYVALCHAPALLKRLPRPGIWMESVRHFLAYPMLASALWLAWVLGHQLGINSMAQLLAGALLLPLALHLWKTTNNPTSLHNSPRRGGLFTEALCASRRRCQMLAFGGGGATSVVTSQIVGNWLSKLASLGVWALALYLAASLGWQQPDVKEKAAVAGQEEVAEVYSAEALAAARAQGPVLVNFTAAWCITCKVNELNALSSAAFYAALERHKVTYLKADWTNEDPAITAALQEYGRSGVPLYLYYAQGSERARILPQLLTESLVLRVLAGVR